jgi:hypothetical protein
MIPMIILCGNAGVGKDTVGNYLHSNHGAVCLAQADLMKRICKTVFGFTDQQLWGPSQFRNEIDGRFPKGKMCHVKYSEQTFWTNFREFDGNDGAYYSFKFKEWFYSCIRHGEVEGLTPRFCLQTLGTEWGRAIDQNLWTNIAVDAAFKLLSNPGLDYIPSEGLVKRKSENCRWESGLVVITDGRFRSEILKVSSVGGFAIKIVRPGVVGLNSHASETELKDIPEIFFDAIINNNDSLDLLRVKTDQMVSRLIRKAPKF